ncbi:CoA transferase [Thauera linaloolentis]|uniref:CAIB/BAIF family protein n=1 Tax=Thauera linaloolentis (strain DSM 12138 / JCM 21573 / CCUG 41526 / CIP 105981 / IAM 15112 / NBRC 102519 / 47Lol) TaxID=1123367 RepID=N6YFF3_THAL4|nr:CoA transferase [Thauera linaloolentis]ENO90245.1 CAIB/BAIF family protein [Thauera linaloolentis 47Lol = DSM 12138]MCM8566264.1 CoA transferase [Thauera linaloolentis]
MPPLLNQFSLLHAQTTPFPAWGAMHASFAEQAHLLGIQQPGHSLPVGMDSAAFALAHPALSPIQGHYVSPASWIPLADFSEPLLQAASGIMSVHGRASGRAQPLGVGYLATLTGAMALQATLAAAIGQLRGGTFQQVGVSPLGCGLLGIGQYLAGATAREEREHFLPGRANACLRPPFRSADGAVFELETLDSGPWRCFWESVGIKPDVAGTAWRAFLLRYARAMSPLPAECIEALAHLPYERIQVLAEQAGVAVVPVRTVAQRRQDVDYQRGQGQPWAFSEPAFAPGRPWTASAPTHLPLQGLRVIESCRRIQGPLAGHLLALLGAEVIRLEPPGGDPLRAMPPCADGCSVRFDALNHLKRIQEVDIKSPEGRQLIHELVRESDVFLHNWAPGKAQALMLDAEHLHAVRPQLVYAYAGGWGSAPVTAPGTDFTVQAWSGVADAIATASGTSGGSLFTVLDVLGGVLATLGVTAALLRRSLTGTGVHVESSLLGAADLLIRGNAPPPAGTLSGVYSTRSGLIAIDCQRPEQSRSLATLLEQLAGAACPASLPEQFHALAAAEWEVLLSARGIGACVVTEDLRDLAADPRIAECLGHRAYSFVKSPWSFS